MSSSLVTLADAALAAIIAQRDASGFVVHAFEAERAWLPYTELKDLPANGKVWVVPMGMDDLPPLNRNKLIQRELPIQIGIQQEVNPNETATIDALVELDEQLRNLLRKTLVVAGYQWDRNESLKNESGTPFGFTAMREINMFESYFTAYFTAQYA